MWRFEGVGEEMREYSPELGEADCDYWDTCLEGGIDCRGDEVNYLGISTASKLTKVDRS